MCVKGGQGTTRVIQPSGMPSVMHTADHSQKMRKICSDAQLINDGGSVNMYIAPFFFCCCQSDNPCQTGRRVSGGCSDGVRPKTCDFVAYPCDSVTSAVVSKCCRKYCVLPSVWVRLGMWFPQSTFEVRLNRVAVPFSHAILRDMLELSGICACFPDWASIFCWAIREFSASFGRLGCIWAWRSGAGFMWIYALEEVG